LIYKYKQQYIKQNLDTLIPDNEIQKYYEDYSANFMLNTSILKGLFLVIPRTAPKSWQPRRWYKSDRSEDFVELEKYCAENNIEIKYFEEEWIPFKEILDLLPRRYSNPSWILRGRKSYEQMDSTYYYCLKISDYRLEGSISPLETVQEDIKSILLNKRKFELINELERNIFDDASNRGNITTY
jgi:hypothetical protein